MSLQVFRVFSAPAIFLSELKLGSSAGTSDRSLELHLAVLQAEERELQWATRLKGSSLLQKGQIFHG